MFDFLAEKEKKIKRLSQINKRLSSPINKNMKSFKQNKPTNTSLSNFLELHSQFNKEEFERRICKKIFTIFEEKMQERKNKLSLLMQKL